MTDLTSDLPHSGHVRTRFYPAFGKRALDLTLALVLLPLLAPVIAALWLLTRLDGGPGFYGHSRIGRHGQPFRCWKIRSMIPDADRVLADTLASDPFAALEWARAFKLQNDPRVTPLGRVLRRTSLDELPQIWNVLRGEMSLVGPRPVTAGELAYYDGDPAAYLSQTPGITGLWQVEGRADGCYAQRVRLDRRYLDAQCLAVDLTLILRTAFVVLAPTGR